MAKKGRPKWIPTKEILDQVEIYAALGLKKNSIAFSVGLNPSTYSEKQTEFPELNEAFLRGRAKGVARAAAKLKEMVDDKHFPAIQFFLKSQDNWKENDPLVQHITPIRVKVTDGRVFEIGPDGSSPETE